MATISLEGMRFHAPHGVFDEEKRMGNEFEVEVHLESDISLASRTDQLEQAVDYARVYDCVAEIMNGPSRNLLEYLVGQMGQSILAQFPQVQKVRVSLAKLTPPVSGPVARSRVTETFSR